jgi:PadR family transcriptional regulator, regulatory protein AphA
MRAQPGPLPDDRRLGAASYAVLALVERSGRATPYELKALAARSGIAHAWSLSHTQLYASCRSLAAAGLLEERVETAGRRRRFYAIAQEGRALLARWRAAPAEEPVVTHDPGLLQLCCGAPPRELARTRTAVHRRAIREIERRRAALPPGTEPGVALTWDAVLARERMWLAFWEHERARLDREAARADRSAGVTRSA